MKEIDEVDLIQTVFSNDQGRKLMDHWQTMFVKRISFHPDNTPEQTAFLEGQRYIIQSIIDMTDMPRSK